MSKITNNGFTQSGTGHFRAVSIWASQGYSSTCCVVVMRAFSNDTHMLTSRWVMLPHEDDRENQQNRTKTRNWLTTEMRCHRPPSVNQESVWDVNMMRSSPWRHWNQLHWSSTVLSQETRPILKCIGKNSSQWELVTWKLSTFESCLVSVINQQLASRHKWPLISWNQFSTKNIICGLLRVTGFSLQGYLSLVNQQCAACTMNIHHTCIHHISHISVT